ncbi:MAG: ABC transporter ATP-binding protein [Sphaerochaetaceae bacterium]
MSLSLRYDKVNKIFDEDSKHAVHALRDISFSIEPGELFCLLGPSGCGKTTLLRSTAGLEKISGGSIYYGDKDVTTIPPFRRNIGMVFQSFALYPHMNVFENVAYGLRVRKVDSSIVKEKVTDIMKLVGLEDVLKRNPAPSALSGGQQQRVAIARALVYDPDILLLDEPLANLDAKLRRYMRAEIRRIQKATNITTIFVTHDQEEAMAVGDRLAVLRDGVVEQIGSSDDLYNYPQNPFVANFIGKMNFFKVKVAKITEEKVDVRLNDTLSFSLDRSQYRSSSDLKTEDELLIAARPEHLSIAKQCDKPAIEGKVTIIQHLGHIVRYEVKVDPSYSRRTLEIDMEGKVAEIVEQDTVKILFNENRLTLYTQEGQQ